LPEVLNFSQQYKSDLLHSIVPALGAWRLKPKFLQISNATQLRIFSCLLFCVCAKHGRLQNQKRLANTDINVPFRRILKILQPNFNSNEELWRHSQKKPVAVERKWIRLRLRKNPVAIQKQTSN